MTSDELRVWEMVNDVFALAGHPRAAPPAEIIGVGCWRKDDEYEPQPRTLTTHDTERLRLAKAKRERKAAKLRRNGL